MSIKSFFKKLVGSEAAAVPEPASTPSPAPTPAPASAPAPAPSVNTAQRAYINPQPIPKTPSAAPARNQSTTKPNFNISQTRTIAKLTKFQFQNLISKPIMFAFFDLRATDSTPKFAKAINVSAEELQAQIENRKLTKDFPIVIICQTGEVSMNAAETIFAKGYLNVYVLDGGTGKIAAAEEPVVSDED